MKIFYLKTGQVLGPIFIILIVLVIMNFIGESARSNDEVIGYGMLLPMFVMQISPLILGFILTTAISSLILYRGKNNKEVILRTRTWVALYKINLVITIIGLVMFGIPFLLFLITFLTFE